MLGERQEELIYKNKLRKIVQGVFYVNGTRYKRKICTFKEANLDDSGKSLSKTKAADKRYKSLVRKLYSEIERQLIEETKKPKATERDMKWLFGEWIDASRATKHPETIKIYQLIQRQYLKIVGNHQLPMTLKYIDLFINGLKAEGLRTVTINIKLERLKACLNWALERELVDKAPKIKKLPELRRIPTVLEQKEVDMLIKRIQELIRTTNRKENKVCYESHLRFLLILLGTGMRRSEVFYLRWQDIDLESGKILVRSHGKYQVKEKKDKVVLIPDYLKDFLNLEKQKMETDSLFSHLYSRPSAMTTAFVRHLKAIKLHGRMKSVHGFRALFATDLYRQGINPYTIKTMLGHSNISVTEIYLTDPKPAQKDATEKLRAPEVLEASSKDS